MVFLSINMMNSELTTKRRKILHAKDTLLERNVYIILGISVFVVVIILPISLFVLAKRRKSNMRVEDGHNDFVFPNSARTSPLTPKLITLLPPYFVKLLSQHKQILGYKEINCSRGLTESQQKENVTPDMASWPVYFHSKR